MCENDEGEQKKLPALLYTLRTRHIPDSRIHKIAAHEELNAMKTVYEILSPLSEEAQERVLRTVAAFYKITV